MLIRQAERRRVRNKRLPQDGQTQPRRADRMARVNQVTGAGAKPPVPPTIASRRRGANAYDCQPGSW
jgi:hypothetical protein